MEKELVLVETIVWLNLKTKYIDSLLCHISVCFHFSSLYSVFLSKNVVKLPLACHKSFLTWKVDKLNKCILFEVLLYGFTQNTEYIITPY